MTNDISAILLESAVLLLVGMSVVFVFLTMLIGAIQLIEWICNKFPETDIPATSGSSLVAAPSNSQVSPEQVAAITAAVHQYRNKK